MRCNHLLALATCCAALFAGFATTLSAAGPVTKTAIAAQHTSILPYEQKLEVHLKRVLRASYGQIPPMLDAAKMLCHTDPAGRVSVSIESTDIPGLVQALTRPDVTLTFADSNFGSAEAWVPLSLLPALAADPAVRWITPTLEPVTRTVTSQGDAIMHADQARLDTGYDGTGVRVGVISNGNKTVPTSISAGELPANTHIVVNNTKGNEGTAMMEIVHDLAPGSDLYFASGSPQYDPSTGNPLTTNGGTMIGAIRSLEASGCGVIVDDLGFYNQSMFSDDDIAQEASYAVSQGYTYVSAGGNDRKKHYIGTYSDGGTAYAGAPDEVAHAHEFAPSTLEYDIDIGGTSSAANPTTLTVILQWDDPWNAPVNHYQLYCFGNNATLLDSSVDPQAGVPAHPYESVGAQNSGGGLATVHIVVSLASGSPARFHLYALGAVQSENFYSPERGIFGHPAAPGVISVAAIDALGPTSYNTVEDYSDYGPTEINQPSAQLRQTPTLAGIDHVLTSVPGFNPFPGTSAAAPHVAAVAALLKQAAPELTPAQVTNALTTTATDVETAGIDYHSGAGLVNADAAMLWIRPDVSASPNSLVLTGYEGRFGSTAAHITLSNAVSSRGASMQWSVAADQSWVHFNRTNGRANSTDEFSVWADTNGLAAPGASANITVTLQHCIQKKIVIPLQLNLTAAGPTITVNATVKAGSGTTTFGDAVTYANSHPGTTIKFAVPSSDSHFVGGVVKIPATSGLIQLTQPGTMVDGFSQTVSGGDTNANGPEVQFVDTLYFTSSYNCVRGVNMASIPNVVGANQVQPAIWFDGPSAFGNTVVGCYIGCDPTGQIAAPTQAGVEMSNGSGRNRVGGTRAADRNIICGFSSVGIQAFNGGQDNIIVGNWVGIDPTGAHAVGSQVTGIQLQYNVTHNAVGGPGTAANVVSGVQYGIVLYATGVSANHVYGNLVGTNPGGSAAIQNAFWGITAVWGAAGNYIGGAGAGERNVVCGNGNAGIVLDQAGTNNNRVVGNYIGVAADGVSPLPNAGGVVIADGASQNVIGGTTVVPTTANIIVGNNGSGVWIYNGATQNYVEGNAIGVLAMTGGVALGNGGPGVYISGTSKNNTIGGLDPADGTAADAGNVIAYNGFDGVDMTADSSLTNVVSRNSIHDNTALAIDLGNDGIPETDTDPYYHTPSFTGAYLYGGFTLVTGTLHNGTDAATLQFYASVSANPSGGGDGQQFLLSILRPSPGPFTLVLPPLPVGTVLSAVAIHTGGTNPGDTSEFSNAVTVQNAPSPYNAPPNVGLVQPNGGTVVTHGAIQPVVWSVDTPGLVLSQNLDYSLDSGATWIPILNAIPPDVRSWAWKVPNVSSTHARMRVRVDDFNGNEGTGASATDFTIVGTGLSDAVNALRIAGGLATSDAAAMTKLNIATNGASAGRIDVADAVAIARKAAGL